MKLFVLSAAALLMFGKFAIRPSRVAAASPSPSPAASACDRTCLNGFVDQYLAALVAHDPSKLPHSANIKFTENNVELKLGDGLWATIDGMGTYKVYVDDPQAGQVGFFGVTNEDGHTGIFAARLKVVDQKVTELETIVARRDNPNSGFPNPEGLKEKPLFYEDAPAEERLPREKLIALASGYFDTIQQNTGKIYTSFDPDCQRMENGAVTANNPNGSGVAKMGCEAQLQTGLLKFVTRCRDRRFVVDEQRNMVLVSTFFDHAGDLRTFKMVDGTEHKVGPPFDRPYTFLILELFKIKNGKISQIEAVLDTVPYHMPSPWVKYPK